MFCKVFVADFDSNNNAVALIQLNKKIVCSGLFDFNSGIFFIHNFRKYSLEPKEFYTIFDELNARDWANKIIFSKRVKKKCFAEEYFEMWKNNH